MNRIVLEARQLEKIYKGATLQQPAVARVDLCLVRGSFNVIMGRSGSGKSTLLHLISGLDDMTNGEVWVQGQAIHLLNERDLALLRRNEIGIVFQQAHLIPNLTVMENVLVAGYLGSHAKNRVLDRTIELLQKCGLEDLKDRLPAELSGGEQQRCAIARAVINNPSLLLADEPTGSLNAASSELILDLFEHLHKSGQTILMVTHDLRSACRGDRILYFDDGCIKSELTFEDQKPIDRNQLLVNWLNDLGW